MLLINNWGIGTKSSCLRMIYSNLTLNPLIVIQILWTRCRISFNVIHLNHALKKKNNSRDIYTSHNTVSRDICGMQKARQNFEKSVYRWDAANYCDKNMRIVTKILTIRSHCALVSLYRWRKRRREERYTYVPNCDWCVQTRHYNFIPYTFFFILFFFFLVLYHSHNYISEVHSIR